jgi:L-arabinose isomerase
MLASAGGSRQSTIEEIGAFRDDKQQGTPGAIWTQPAAAPAVLVGCWLTNRKSGQDMDHPVRIAEHISWFAGTWFAGSLRLEPPQTMLADCSRSLVMTNVIWGRPGMNTFGHQLKVGLFGIGLDTYWPQFPGLQDRLIGYTEQVALNLANSQVRVINLGLIDTPEKSLVAGHEFRRADVDLIFLYVTTYALSATVLPAVRRAKVPVIILNLAPAAAIDYERFNHMGDRAKMTGEWLAYCQACPVPEIANVFNRCRIPFFQVSGMLENDPVAWGEIAEWIEAARVAQVMEHNRLGLMGNYYGGMLDIYSDLTQQCAHFGGHVEILEVDELTALRQEVSDSDLERRVGEFRTVMEVQPDCPAEELQRAARTSVALDRLVEIHALGSLAYYHKGLGSADNQDTISSIILGTSLLTARGVPVAGEYEIKNAQAMKIMDSFGAGGSFTEYYAVDYNDDVVLMGHDGPGHIAIAEGKTKVRALEVYHGKAGHGLSVEMSVKLGPVTLLSIVQTADGRLKLLVAEGESVKGPILEIGNTNSRYRFSLGARCFMNQWNVHGPAHHCAVGVGHVASKLKKLSALLDMECTQIC